MYKLSFFSANVKWFFSLVLLAFATDAAYEGASCVHNGEVGVCTVVMKCPSVLADIKNKRPVTNCSFAPTDNMTPIVCCVSSSTTAPFLTTTKRAVTSSSTEYTPPVYDYVDVVEKAADGCPLLPPAFTSPRNGDKAWDKCVEYQEKYVYPCTRSNALLGGLTRSSRCHHNADELIVGGVEAGVKEFPHMALLGYGADESQLQWLCGGALVSERYVLTAGHCTGTRDFGPVTYAALGLHRRSDDPSGLRRHKVTTIVKHPEYAPPQKYHDIALIELDGKVILDEYTIPACLHTGDPVDERASATGWGLTQEMGTTSDVLQKVILEKFDNAVCSSTYGATRLMKQGFDQNTQLCYGDRNKPKDTCQRRSSTDKVKKVIMYVRGSGRDVIRARLRPPGHSRRVHARGEL